MSYTKLKITYYTDSLTRQGKKHRTLAVPQKVQEYGDKYGYYNISLSYSRDRLYLIGDCNYLPKKCLMDIDINGTNNNEYIRGIVSHEWLP